MRESGLASGREAWGGLGDAGPPKTQAKPRPPSQLPLNGPPFKSRPIPQIRLALGDISSTPLTIDATRKLLWRPLS